MPPIFGRRQPPPEPAAPELPSDLEIAEEAFSREEWATAAHFAEACLSRDSGRRTAWMLAASAHERLGDPGLKRSFTQLGNRLAPATGYDSTTAFDVYAPAPYERDSMANFLIQERETIRSGALARVANADTERPTHAYVYWDTTKRPAIVEKCIESLRSHLPESMTLIPLDASSAKNRLQRPEEIIEGIERPAHRSDVLRTHLLSDGGGLWLDATCLINDSFPWFAERITAENFFMFTYRGSRIGNWFWWATPSSYRLQAIRVALDLWLTQGREWSNYFMFHDLTEMLYWTDDLFRAEWDAGLFMHPREALAMNAALGKSLADHEWFDLSNRHPVNKLTWKFPEEKLEDPSTGVARLLAKDRSSGHA